MATAPSPLYYLLKYLHGSCPAAATSAHRANRRFPAIHCNKRGLSCSLPFSKAASQSTETWTSCAFGSVSFPPTPAPVSVWQVQTFLLTSYLAINASPALNAASHRALTLTCMVAKNATWREKMRPLQSRSEPGINVLSELRDKQIPDPALFWSRNIDLDVSYCTGFESVSTSFRKAILATINPLLYHIFPRSFCFSVFA